MKIKLTIPESLADVKLSQYQKYVRTTKDSEDSIFINRQKVAIFCNVADELIAQLKKTDYDTIVKIVDNTLNTQGKFQSIIKHNSRELGFIPDGLENITVGELADIDNNLKDVKDYHKAMEVLYRPIISKRNSQYLIEDYTPTGKGLDLTMDVVSGALVFFSTLTIALLNFIPNFIKAEVQTNPKLQHLAQNGGGINHFTDLLKEMCLNINVSLN